MWLSRAALPHLKASGDGRIVGISSLIGNHAWLAGLDAYAASKAGMNGIARSLAIEFAKYGATVNVIEPGLVIDDRSPRMDDRRSEEHTSELQSLMRISYAVFCLKKKNTHNTRPYHNN